MIQGPAPGTVPPPLPPGTGVNRRFATLRAVIALMLREMATRYGRSPGGYLWAVLEPLGAITVMAVGFALIVRHPPLGSSFILFFATAFLPFSLYMNISNHVSRAIEFSRPLLFYPAVTWVDAVLARFVLNMLTDLLVMAILLGSFLAMTGARVILDIGPILESVALGAFLGLGIGVLNCALIGLFPVWMQVWSIANRPLFLVSGVLFLYEDLPQSIQGLLWFNPLLHITGLMRQGFYPTYTGAYISGTFVVLVAAVTLFLGVVLLGRYHRDILNA